ncbi:probable LRR receptor-like serine/threonine-protein kinase At1g56130 [Prosopis cineraria]|uniref:probable LRR receptor-like serine/threonine-protein kinase At1g56130 n=1 Tax=Prosopis cineraria TaxID=364024 RepID=UPI0024103158|nr:probable LRR receptor-like serine/threonine-protein kinase At1g56130 [Prosopis cineraria]
MTMTRIVDEPSEGFISYNRMPRRAIEVASPCSSQNIQASSLHTSEGLFFFFGGIVVLIILLILIFVFRNHIKPAKLMKMIVWNEQLPPNKQHPPNKQQRDDEPAEVLEMIVSTRSMELMSGSLRTIIYFDYGTLKKATKNFHSVNLLGSGGFGPVYRGKLANGRLIAVKKLSLNKSQQGEREFLAEVRMITSIQHKNLVCLIGCCTEGIERILVYEYMKNKSLDLYLYGNNDRFLDWSTRFQIILGIARGLQYLHEDSHIRIVHRDIKASNILLDDKFHPRIGDFGLARFFPEDEDYLSTQFAGTLGYTAPEYAIRGELSEKADIYSFGVLVLEIISCRKNTDLTLPSERQYLPEYAWKLFDKSRLMDLVDPKLLELGFIERDVKQAIHVAFLCIQSHANLRPPMSEIVALLTFKMDMVKTPVRPSFLGQRHRKDDESHSWETISQLYPSPVPSDSASMAKSLK